MLERDLFAFGVEGLDELLKGALLPGTLVVVAGHPGAGKTTLGASMCYANAVKGRKCLYISVQEPKDKFMMYMDLLGIRLKDLEKTGSFRYVKLPQMAGLGGGFDAVEFIDRQISEYRPDIVIVDSVTPILKAIGEDMKARSMLQEYFSEVLRRDGGLMVLLSEIPLLEASMGIGDIEFVADVIIFLKHSIERNRLVREVEIRKARGSPITLARVPFSIERGVGLRVWTPPSLEEIPGRRREMVYELPCSPIRDVIGRLYGGMVIYGAYPPDARPHSPLSVALSLAKMNRKRALIFTYNMTPDHIYQEISEYFENLGCSKGRIKGDIERHIIDVIGLNPAAMSSEELYAMELKIVHERKPDIVVFYGVESFVSDIEGYTDLLRNQLLLLRKKGVLVARLGSLVSEEFYNLYASLADVVFRFDYRMDYGGARRLKSYLYLWSAGNEPVILDHEDLRVCRAELRELLCGGDRNNRN